MGKNNTGFTSYTNESVCDGRLPDNYYRFRQVLESHMGKKGLAKVRLSTLAREMGKCWKTAARIKDWFLENSNLKVRKVGGILEYYTDPDMGVLYGKTRVSHIVVHPDTLTKISNKKNIFKNTEEVFSSKEEEEKGRRLPVLSSEEQALVDEIADWEARPIFKSMYSRKQLGYIVRAKLIKHGYDTLNKVYQEVAVNGGNPHPKPFWERLKELDSMASVPK